MTPNPTTGDPAVCLATLTELPATGAAPSNWLLVAAVALVIGGAVLLATTSRRSIRGAWPGAAAVILAAAILTPAAPSAAHAASIEYGDGCTLIEVRDVTRPASAQAMLPGDDRVVLTAVLANRYSQTIIVDGAAILESPLGDAMQLNVDLSRAAGPITLAPSEQIPVTVRAHLPPSAGDDMQGLIADLTLVLTATVE